MNKSVLWNATKNIKNHKDLKVIKSLGKMPSMPWSQILNMGTFFRRSCLKQSWGKPRSILTSQYTLYKKYWNLSKTLTYEFQYDYIQPKHWSKLKLFYISTGSFCVWDRDKDIAKDIETRLDTSGYSKDDNRSLPIKKRFRKVAWQKMKLVEKMW